MSFFKTRFFCILLAVAIVLVLVPSIFAITGNMYVLKNIFNAALTPVRSVVNSFCEAAAGYGNYFSTVNDLREENRKLKDTLKDYEDRIAELEKQAGDSEWLSAFLDMKEFLEDSEYIKADICERITVGGVVRYTVNVGSIHGIKKDMSVLCGNGVFGKVSDVGINWATVCTPIDTTVSFGVCNQRNKVRGYTRADIEVSAEGVFKVRFISTDADVVVGDTIVTVGDGDTPDGITVGVVESVSYNEYDRVLEAYVRPVGDYGDEYALMIVISNEYSIVDYDKNEAETGEGS